MCDTLTVTSTASADSIALLAKNSDREPNEAHEVVLLPAMDYAPGSRVRCTYIDIDQAPHTFAVALAKPFWIWGAEMGVNEHGVAIGNEAVFTRESYAKDGGLTGMDLLRLGLERGATAREALQAMIDPLGPARPGRQLRLRPPALLPQQLSYRRCPRGLGVGDGRPPLGRAPGAGRLRHLQRHHSG